MLRSLWAFRQRLGFDVEQRAVLAEAYLTIANPDKLHLNGLGGDVVGPVSALSHVTSDAACRNCPAGIGHRS